MGKSFMLYNACLSLRSMLTIANQVRRTNGNIPADLHESLQDSVTAYIHAILMLEETGEVPAFFLAVQDEVADVLESALIRNAA